MGNIGPLLVIAGFAFLLNDIRRRAMDAGSSFMRPLSVLMILLGGLLWAQGW